MYGSGYYELNIIHVFLWCWGALPENLSVPSIPISCVTLAFRVCMTIYNMWKKIHELFHTQTIHETHILYTVMHILYIVMYILYIVMHCTESLNKMHALVCSRAVALFKSTEIAASSKLL